MHPLLFPRFLKSSLASLLVLLVSACSTISSRLNERQAVFAAATLEQQQLMREGRVAVGFSPEMVYIALGRPDSISTSTSTYGTTEHWYYRDVPHNSRPIAPAPSLDRPSGAQTLTPTQASMYGSPTNYRLTEVKPGAPVSPTNMPQPVEARINYSGFSDGVVRFSSSSLSVMFRDGKAVSVFFRR